jgi:hypothetical protein
MLHHLAGNANHFDLFVEMLYVGFDVDVGNSFAREIDGGRAVVRDVGVVLERDVEIAGFEVIKEAAVGDVEEIAGEAIGADVNGAGGGGFVAVAR